MLKPSVLCDTPNKCTTTGRGAISDMAAYRRLLEAYVPRPSNFESQTTMATNNGVRSKPALASGFAASLQIAPRDYHYTVCSGCDRKLYFTYVGEDCPHCGAAVTVFVEGQVPPLNRMAEACLAAAARRA